MFSLIGPHHWTDHCWSIFESDETKMLDRLIWIYFFSPIRPKCWTDSYGSIVQSNKTKTLDWFCLLSSILPPFHAFFSDFSKVSLHAVPVKNAAAATSLLSPVIDPDGRSVVIICRSDRTSSSSDFCSWCSCCAVLSSKKFTIFNFILKILIRFVYTGAKAVRIYFKSVHGNDAFTFFSIICSDRHS